MNMKCIFSTSIKTIFFSGFFFFYFLKNLNKAFQGCIIGTIVANHSLEYTSSFNDDEENRCDHTWVTDDTLVHVNINCMTQFSKKYVFI